MSAAPHIGTSPTPADLRTIHSLVDMLDFSVARHAPLPMFLTKIDGRWTELTYAGFKQQVNQLRGGLASLGVGPKDRVGIIANNGVPWAAAAYATYGLGAAFVPMYESQAEREWAFIVRDAGIKVLFVANADIYRRVSDLPQLLNCLEHVVLLEGEGARLSYQSLLRAGAEHPVESVHPAPPATACLMYTSGTTGEPKGVILSHANILSNVGALLKVIPLSTEYRTLSFLPWAHAFGHTVELHLLVAVGASMGIAESIDALVKNFAEVRPSVLVAVPRVFERVYAGVHALMDKKAAPLRWLFQRGLEIARRRRAGQSVGPGARLVLALANGLLFRRMQARFGGRLRFAVSGAAALSPEASDLMETIGVSVYEGYGLTEASPVVAANVPGRRKPGSVGRPLPDVQVEIDRSANDDASDRERIGEIVVHGPNVMAGYHNREADTRAVIDADRGLRTGDLGYLDEDGFLFITGRIKEQYKLSNGKYVAPARLEDRLKVSPHIANVMVYGDNRPYNVALVVPNPGCRVDGSGGQRSENQVRRLISGEIEKFSSDFKGFERIRAFALLTEDFTQANQLLTPSLKLKRRLVVHRFSQEIDRLYRDGPFTSADLAGR
ncbi:MAG TPA: long-chain fatty acid--CoA ligase [Polyangia bacterium]|nr:long-chain fatty acid--CoA ligase [Polyangia bacterium]